MVNLPGPTGMGNRHSQHDTMFTSTPGGPLQGYPGGDTQSPEADWRRQISLVTRVASQHCYHLTFCQGLLCTYSRGPLPRGRERVELTRGVHQALADFQWLVDDPGRCPTRLHELVPLQPTIYGYHNAPRYMCGVQVLPGPTVVSRTPQQQPITAATY